MKALKIIGKVLLYILVTVVLLLLVLRLGVTVRYFDYFNHGKSEFLVPGLNTAFVAQGFDYVPDENCYLVSGYMSDGSASRIYLCYEMGDDPYVELKNSDGTDYVEHCGGVCYNGQYVYVPGPNGLDVFKYEDILYGSTALCVGSIEIGFRVDYCSFYNGYLLVGNFYHQGDYETPAEHRITTPAGDANTGLLTVFKADEWGDFGIDPTPVAAFSTTEKVQGICFTSDDELVLSTSYSVYSSYLYYHRIDLTRSSTVTVLDAQIPLYYLDSATLTDTVELPPMSEELVYRNGRVYVMCESACNKYIYGKFIRGHQVFSYSEEQ